MEFAFSFCHMFREDMAQAQNNFFLWGAWRGKGRQDLAGCFILSFTCFWCFIWFRIWMCFSISLLMPFFWKEIFGSGSPSLSSPRSGQGRSRKWCETLMERDVATTGLSWSMVDPWLVSLCLIRMWAPTCIGFRPGFRSSVKAVWLDWPKLARWVGRYVAVQRSSCWTNPLCHGQGDFLGQRLQDWLLGIGCRT